MGGLDTCSDSGGQRVDMMKTLEALSCNAHLRPKCSQGSQSMFRLSRMG